MFREDFEFNDAAGLSHLSASPAPAITPAPVEVAAAPAALVWAPDAEKELTKIPFFVRGKARRNTENFAAKHGIALIELETLYDARSHFSR